MEFNKKQKLRKNLLQNLSLNLKKIKNSRLKKVNRLNKNRISIKMMTVGMMLV
nr:MAG TPA: hypothetical protein [Crassvirales sp.]